MPTHHHQKLDRPFLTHKEQRIRKLLQQKATLEADLSSCKSERILPYIVTKFIEVKAELRSVMQGVRHVPVL